MDVLTQVRATIDGEALLPRGGTVVVAVSGGPDSLCLLHVLLRLRGEYGVGLHVAHLNHGLRPEAEADAAFVAALAAAWHLPCAVGRVDVRALAAAERRSLEEAARLARYRFLAEVACAQGAGTVAVGHNADDQVETVLMHCLRGAGLAGLRGMRRRARWPEGATAGCAAPTLIRPLLDVPRRDIEAYVEAQGLEPRFDRTNLERAFYRNRIRHELVPILETYNPRIRERLHHTADVLADDYDYLQQSLDALWPELVLAAGPEAVALRRDVFRGLPPSPQRALLRRALLSLRRSLRDIGWLHLEQARRTALSAAVGSIAMLPAGLLLEVGYERLIVRPAAVPWVEPQAAPLLDTERPLQVPGLTPLAGGWAIEARLAEQATPGAGRLQACFDADRAGRELHLRRRRPGDRFQPRGLGGRHKSVKDYMIDAKIPRGQR
nr:tRNA lysidine(34) synthetase TilS [Anaerolineae bacterium]